MIYINGLELQVGRAFEFYSEMGPPRPAYDDAEWISFCHFQK